MMLSKEERERVLYGRKLSDNERAALAMYGTRPTVNPEEKLKAAIAEFFSTTDDVKAFKAIVQPYL